MGFKAVGVSWILVMALTSCGADDPQSQLNEIEQLQTKRFPMTEAQRNEIASLVSEGSALLAAGQRDASSEKFDRALKLFNQAADADRFNKSE